MIKKSKQHLQESNMSYFYHMKHSLYQGSRLIIHGLKSYLHAFIPPIYKYDGPKFVITLFKELRQVTHMKKLIEKELANDKNRS